MDITALKQHIYDLNEDELFYREYYKAGQDPTALKKFLVNLDMKDVLKRHLLIPEKKETIPPFFEDSYFFDLNDHDSIIVQKHNRYSPALLHKHTFFELLYVYDGKCDQKISGQSLTMHSGDFCIIPPGIEHSISVFDDSIILNIMLRRDTLHSMFYAFLNTPNILSSFFLNNIYTKKANDYIMFHTGTDPYLKDSFLWMLWESMNKQQYYYQAITNTLLLDFYLIIRNYGESVQMPLFDSRIDVQRYALIQYVQENYKDVTLSSLSAKFHYSNEYTSRLIKELTGMNYTEILRSVRIERSEDLLANSTMTVASIAEAVGYDTTEHYIRQFKKHTGMTPSAFRKQSASIRNA
jgi:AraC-like DNA-binding protein/mannose-6-phosphate isomerase-like protein (cupin superfamily)